MSKTRKPGAKRAPKTAPSVSSPKKLKSQDTVDLVRELASILNRRNLSELVVELPDATITLRSGRDVHQQVALAVPTQPMHLPLAPPPPPAALDADDVDDSSAESGNGKYQIVSSPFVGTFYRSPGPEADPFVEVGNRVEKGQVLCIVEAMKLMNEIEAEYAGVIAAVLVENAQSVEYGQPLFKISAG